MQMTSLRLLAVLASLAALSSSACEVAKKRIGRVHDARVDERDGDSSDGQDGSPSPDGSVGGGLSVSLVSDAEGGSLCAGSCVTVQASATGGDGTYRVSWSDPSLEGLGPHTYCPSEDTTLQLELSDESEGEFGPSTGSTQILLSLRDCAAPADGGSDDAQVETDGGWSAEGCIELPASLLDERLTFCEVEPFQANILRIAITVGRLVEPGELYEFRQRGTVSSSGTLSIWDGTFEPGPELSMNKCTLDRELDREDYNVLVGEREIPLVGCFRAKAGNNAVFVKKEAPLFGGSGYGGNGFTLCRGCPTGTAP